MASSAKQLESAKAFYAQMHAHLKAKSLDNDSDDWVRKCVHKLDDYSWCHVL